jgi:hypothetical protein
LKPAAEVMAAAASVARSCLTKPRMIPEKDKAVEAAPAPVPTCAN